MKKKLFIEDLEKRRSTSSLFVSMPGVIDNSGTLSDVNNEKKSSWKKPSERVTTNVSSEGGNHTKDGSLKPLSTMSLGEEGKSPKDGGGHTTMAMGEGGHLHRDGESHGRDHFHHKDGGGHTTMAMGEEGHSPKDSGGKITSAALGEEGKSPKPKDDGSPVIAMYAVIDPTGKQPTLGEKPVIGPIAMYAVKDPTGKQPTLGKKPVIGPIAMYAVKDPTGEQPTLQEKPIIGPIAMYAVKDPTGTK
jgi:hypothetical protein